jgi:hypothetical protein
LIEQWRLETLRDADYIAASDAVNLFSSTFPQPVIESRPHSHPLLRRNL